MIGSEGDKNKNQLTNLNKSSNENIEKKVENAVPNFFSELKSFRLCIGALFIFHFRSVKCPISINYVASSKKTSTCWKIPNL